MAEHLSGGQVDHIVDILRNVKDVEVASDLHVHIDALRRSAHSAFTDAALDDAAAAITALEVPVASRRDWPSSTSRGHFFVFEGLDRSGKSTQSKLLAKHFEKDRAVQWMCFPNRATALGTLIDLYLLKRIEMSDKMVHLLFSANRWEAAAKLVETLNAGTTVVCDRYAFSGAAYSSAKGLDVDWCKSPDVGVPQPDGVFFMTVDEKVGASRAGFGDERYENESLQSKVRVLFLEPRIRDGVAWHDVDGARAIEEIHAEIRAIADKSAGEVSEIRRLWIA